MACDCVIRQLIENDSPKGVIFGNSSKNVQLQKSQPAIYIS